MTRTVDDDFPEGLATRYGLARAHNDRLRLLSGAVRPSSLREHFALASLDLALEHHSAIVRCAEAFEFGAAAALLRPLLEAGASAFWFVYAAAVEQIAALSTSPDDSPLVDLPDLRTMAVAIEPTFPAVKVLLDGLKSGGAAKWLHKYTHGGTPQLARRGQGGWHPEEIRLLVLRADIFVTMATSVATLLAPDRELAAYVFEERDRVSQILRERYLVSDMPMQPDALPPAPLLQFGGGPPPMVRPLDYFTPSGIHRTAD